MSGAGSEHERAFDLFGTRVRVLLGAQIGRPRQQPSLAALRVEAMLRGLNRELTRFDDDSALSRLNSDPAREVRTTRSVATLVSVAREAAISSGGLVDSAVIDKLERAGYAKSRAGKEPADLRAALRSAPPRRPAQPATASGWNEVEVDLDEAVVRRPPGMRIDSGGLGKGLAADCAAARLRGFTSYAVDCGGDLRIGGAAALERPVEVIYPFDPNAAIELRITAGAIATSGLGARLWRHRGGFSHHLIDPGSGLPAWTGVVQATALAPTAVEAEALAKAALLSGPGRARRVLSEHGGVIVLDCGEVEAIGTVAGLEAHSARTAA